MSNLNKQVDKCEDQTDKENVYVIEDNQKYNTLSKHYIMSYNEALALLEKRYGSNYMTVDNGNYKISD